MSDTYQVTATVSPVEGNNRGVRMTFTDMVTGAICEWQLEDVTDVKGLKLLYFAFTDEALGEMFEMIQTAVNEAQEAINDGRD